MEAAIPNSIAYAALIIWPFVTIALFQMLPTRRAVIWSLLGAYLLLPVSVGFDGPGIPRMDKSAIPALSTLVCTMLFARGKVWDVPRSMTTTLLIALFVLSPVLTGMNNTDAIVLYSRILPGMQPYDWLATCVGQALQIIPFVLGYGVLSREGDQRDLLMAFAVAGLAYSVPMLWEVRMSPQLHAQIYGFFPHSFLQQVRDGSYRPVVFLGHGLLVATFTAMALVAASGLWRQRAQILRIPAAAATVYLGGALIICKSMGALILGFLFAAILRLFSPRLVVRLSAIIGLMIVAYPALRGADLVPVERIVSLASKVNEARASSFEFRVKNENLLLDKARQRPAFGWGTYGRNRVFGEGWGRDGWGTVDLTTTDGTWIIKVGVFGWVGYIACFGLLCLPFVLSLRASRSANWNFSLVALTVMLLVNVMDLIPNSSLTPLTWLLAGTLCGAQMRRLRNVPRPAPRPLSYKLPEEQPSLGATM